MEVIVLLHAQMLRAQVLYAKMLYVQLLRAQVVRAQVLCAQMHKVLSVQVLCLKVLRAHWNEVPWLGWTLNLPLQRHPCQVPLTLMAGSIPLAPHRKDGSHPTEEGT